MSDVSAREVLSKWILANGMDLNCDLDRSHGFYLYDKDTDIEYLDMFSFFAARPIGFNHPKLDTAEFIQEIGKVALHKPSNCDVYTDQYASFVDKFCSVALGGEFAHAFFIEGGSPAVENALKAAMDWKHRRNIAAGKGEKGTVIIHFKECFHGRTGYCLSLTDSPDPRKTQWFPKFDWPRITTPKMRFPFDDAAKADVAALEAKALAEIDEAFNKHGDDVAAILIEPIQGEGGDNYFRPEFMQALRKIADERDVMLIFDEVQTGFGGTGEWWDWKTFGVQPDLMVFGKKTSVCGFAATSKIDEVDSVFKTGSRISSTFEGNLADMVRCRRVIEIIEEDDLIANAKSMGVYLQSVLNAAAEKHDQVTNVRGRGLWAAFDMPDTKSRDALADAAFKEQLIIMTCGDRSIRMRPALDITADAIGRMGAQLEASFKHL